MRKNQQQLSYLAQKKRTESLIEMGSILRQLRQEKSVSIEQLAQLTAITERQIMAIESGDLHELPEPIYIKYLIKRYADSLGFDGSELASSFPPQDPVRSLKPTWISLPIPELRPIHLYVLYIFVIFCSVNSLSYVLNRSLNQDRVQFNIQPYVKYEPAKAPLENAATTVADRHNPEPVRVSMTIDADSWLWIEADGKTEFEGILPTGSERTWVASRQLIIRAGNAGGVRITLNDGLPQKLGELNAVEEVTFKAPPRSRI